MRQSRKIRVLLAHRCTPAAAGLERAFSSQPDFEVVQSSGLADVAVVDCETGLQLLSARRGGRCRVVILTDDDREASVRCAVEKGALGYLLLSSTSAEVVRAARQASDGAHTFDAVVAKKLISSMSDEPLTLRQTEVLRLLMQGLRDKMIAHDIGCGLQTAKAHVKAILAKLHASSRAEAVAIARRRGLVSDAQLHGDATRPMRRVTMSWIASRESPVRSAARSRSPETAGRSPIPAWTSYVRADESAAGPRSRST